MSSKPPKMTSAAKTVLDKDMRFIKAMMDNMAEELDVDWAKVAEDAGLEDSKQPKETYRDLSVKLKWAVSSNKATNSTTSAADEPTEGDMCLIKALFDNMEGKPNTDWEKVAIDYGEVKDKKQAIEKHRVLTIKLGWAKKSARNATTKEVPMTPVTRSTTKKRSHDSDDEDLDESSHPIKFGPITQEERAVYLKEMHENLLKQFTLWDYMQGPLFPGLIEKTEESSSKE